MVHMRSSFDHILKFNCSENVDWTDIRFAFHIPISWLDKTPAAGDGQITPGMKEPFCHLTLLVLPSGFESPLPQYGVTRERVVG